MEKLVNNSLDDAVLKRPRPAASTMAKREALLAWLTPVSTSFIWLYSTATACNNNNTDRGLCHGGKLHDISRPAAIASVMWETWLPTEVRGRNASAQGGSARDVAALSR